MEGGIGIRKILAIVLSVIFLVSLVPIFSPFAKYRLCKAEKKEFRSTFDAAGIIQENNQVELYSDIDSVIDKIEAGKGQTLKKGEVILTYTPGAYDVWKNGIAQSTDELVQALDKNISLAGKKRSEAASYLEGIRSLYTREAATSWQLSEAQEGYNEASSYLSFLTALRAYYFLLGDNASGRPDDVPSLKAPYDCIVENIETQTGETVKRGDLLARITPLHQIFLCADIPGYEGELLNVGDSVDINYTGRTEKGVISKLSPTKSRVFVWIRAEEGGFEEKNSIAVTFYRMQPEEVIAVPKKSVLCVDHIPCLWVADEDFRLSLRRVGIGFAYGNDIQITHGLTEGERVVSNPQEFQFKEGDQLKPRRIEGESS